jgi:hypothetical protein
VIALLLAAVAQVPAIPYIALGDGTPVPIRSFDIGTSDEMARLRSSNADLLIVKFAKWGPKPSEISKSLQREGKARRIVLAEFPALATSPNNGLLWRTDWDSNRDGKPDADAPTWLRPRNADGVYPLDTTNMTLRNRLLGPTGLVATIAKAGFDGIVVSSVADPGRKPGYDARLLSDIMAEGRRTRPGFATFVRNPGALMDFPVIRTLMDGFIADGLFFGQKELNAPSSPEFVEDSVKRLEWASKRQKIVLSIAYTTDANQISENRKLAMERRFIPLARSKRIQPEAEPEPSR